MCHWTIALLLVSCTRTATPMARQHRKAATRAVAQWQPPFFRRRKRKTAPNICRHPTASKCSKTLTSPLSSWWNSRERTNMLSSHQWPWPSSPVEPTRLSAHLDLHLCAWSNETVQPIKTTSTGLKARSRSWRARSRLPRSTAKTKSLTSWNTVCESTHHCLIPLAKITSGLY